MTGKKERRSRFGGMGSVLAQHRLLDAALGPGEGAVDAASETPDAPAEGVVAPTEPLPESRSTNGPSPVDGSGHDTTSTTLAAASAEPAPSTMGSAPPAVHDTEGSREDAGSKASLAPERVPRRPASPIPSSTTNAPVLERAVDDIRPSPFQPRGRPSRQAIEAVERAIAEAGSLDALVSAEGGVVFGRLDGEAARLAELAFDIAAHGVKEPIVTRVAEDGVEECLSGHRRLAAARLAALGTVPVVSRGTMSNANAAATVLSGNLHREAFTTWQEAVLVSEVRERRLAEQLPADVRALGRVMGWASGKAQARLKLRRVLSDELLSRVDADAASADGVVERIGHLGAKELNQIANAAENARRLVLLRRALGIAEPAGPRAADDREHLVLHRPRRGGGFVLEVRQEIETMPLGDLAVVRELLEAQLARVSTRMTTLKRST